jgi:hypothetical protein
MVGYMSDILNKLERERERERAHGAQIKRLDHPVLLPEVLAGWVGRGMYTKTDTPHVCGVEVSQIQLVPTRK